MENKYKNDNSFNVFAKDTPFHTYISSVLLSWQDYFKSLYLNNMTIAKTLSDLNREYMGTFSNTSSSSSSSSKESR